MFEETAINRRRLDGYSYEHDLEGETVRGIVQLNDGHILINDLHIISGMVIDHTMKSSYSLGQEDGRYVIQTETSPQPVWGNFQIIGNNLIRAFSKNDMSIVLSVLSHAIGDNENYATIVNFDLEGMSQTYNDHWIGSIFGRDGNMQRGTFYGTDIRNDDVIGTCWQRNNKSQLGFESNFFGPEPVKVRVGLEGSVQVLANIAEEDYLRFVLTELSPHMINLPRNRRRRTS